MVEPATQQVQVQYYPASTVTNAAGKEEPTPAQYVVGIPDPSEEGALITVMGLATSDMDLSINDKGEWNDPEVGKLIEEEGYEHHIITTESGNDVAVLMKASDWNRYQQGLDEFGRAAASSPNLYQPNQASVGHKMFTPEAQAGRISHGQTHAFMPVTERDLAALEGKFETVHTQSTYEGMTMDYTMYQPTDQAASLVFRNRGYVAVEVTKQNEQGQEIRVTHYAAPLDAQLAAQSDSNVKIQ